MDLFVPNRPAIRHYVQKDERFAGAMDSFEPAFGIRGWVIEPGAPGRPVRLAAVAGERRLATAVAMMDRPDIDAAMGRLTQCGVLFGWSRFDWRAVREASKEDPDATVDIVILETGEAVPSVFAPITVEDLEGCVAAAPDGDRRPTFRDVHAYHTIDDAALFQGNDGADVPEGMPPLLHYVRVGEPAGARPTIYFDPRAHAARYGLQGPGGALLDFLARGPDAVLDGPHFDAGFVAAHHATGDAHPLVAYHKALAAGEQWAPNPHFDPAHYGTHPDVPSGGDLYAHFAREGVRRGLTPSPAFQGALDAAQSHFLEAVKADAGLVAAPPAPAAPVPEVAAAPVPEVAAAPAPEGTPAQVPGGIAPAQVPGALAPAQVPGGITPDGTPDLEALAKTLRDRPVSDAIAAVEAVPQSARKTLARAVAEAEAARAPNADPADALATALAEGAALATERAADAAHRYLGGMDAAGRTPDPATLDALLPIIHTFAERRPRHMADPLYILLFKFGRRDALIVLRLLEAALDSADVARASEMGALLEADHSLADNPWVVISLARLDLLRGDSGAAVARLAALPPFGETMPPAEAAILNTLLGAGANDAMAARLAMVGDGPLPAALTVPRLRLALATSDAAVEPILAAADATDLPSWVLGEAMFRLSAPRGFEPRLQRRMMQRVADLLTARGLEENIVIQALLHYHLQIKDWDTLKTLFEAVGDGLPGHERETRLRKLEFLCQSGAVEEAEAIYREAFQDADLTQWEGLTVLRLLSELKRWDEAGRVLVGHLAKGHGLAGTDHMAMRIVRRARLHEAVLSAMEAGGQEASTERFVALVYEDLAVLRRALALSPQPTRVEGRRGYRSSFVLGHQPQDDRHSDCALFICTNQRYFLSALTFLCSFLGQAPQVGVRLFAFLDGDVPRHWEGALAMVSARFERTIEVVREADFVPDAVEHKTEYGFFAGGSHLSRAAYFRLYATQYLLDRYKLRRAVYTDTDIVCRGDLTGLFDLALDGQPLAAATEDTTLEVIRAAGLNALDPGAYFNSGVLVMDMTSARLSEQMAEAVRVSEEEPERLMFHDQCALNIAFKDAVKVLPSRFNFFLRPSRERNGFIEDGVLLHFVDKPKPWDIVFDRTYREEWRVWALLLGTFLPQDLYVNIFSVANRD